MAASYREVAASLGLEVPADDDELRDVLEADVQKVASARSRGKGFEASAMAP
ncbi:hypothetical protein OHS71_01305 [Streptomyces sp. NBC_00377]|uniref:hypothetical protein n=1 Tax=unclassified Streptomyces TaxID=2593676 RepID=UPI002E218DB1|nr:MULTISPECIES: hypothetical protein [unclassified Streptomyces]